MRLKLVCVALGVVVLVGCGGGGGGANEWPVVLKPGVTIIGTGGLVEIVSATPDTVTVSGDASSLTPGTTLVSGSGEGLLRRIDSVVPSGANTVLNTSEAALADVFESVNLSKRVSMGADQVESFEPALPGVSLDPGPHSPPGRAELGSVHIKIDQVTLEEQGFGRLTASGAIDFTIDLDLAVRFPENYMRCVATVDGEATGTLSASVTSVFANKKWLLGKLTGKPLTIMAGPVPIIIVPKLEIFSRVNGSMKLGASITGTTSYTIQAGIAVSNGNVDGIGELDHTEHLTQTPNFYGSCAFSYTPLRTELGLYLYGVLGPYVDADIPGFDLAFTQSTNPAGKHVTLGGGYTGSAGVKLKFFKGNSLNYEFPNIINTHFDLLDHFFPDNGSVSGEVH